MTSRLLPVFALVLGSAATAQTGSVLFERKIGDGIGGFEGALDAGDRFGSAVTVVGDLDGDGRAEVAVGAPGDDDGGLDRGAVWVLFLDEGGRVVEEQKISALQGGGGLDLLIADGDNFGNGVAGVGDIDGDGIPDLAAGSPNSDVGGPDRGALIVLLMNADGTVAQSVRIADPLPSLGSLKNFDRFGWSVAGVRDLDQDGVPDLAVGAINHDGPSLGIDTGAVYVLFLQSDGSPRSATIITANQVGPLLANDNLGTSVAALGDLDADGTTELVAGAPKFDGVGSNDGSAWLLFLRPDGTLRASQQISALAGGFAGALDSRDNFGSGVGRLGDLNGDGVSDLVVGASRDDDGGVDHGALWILSLDSAGEVIEEAKVSSTAGGLVGPLAQRGRLGYSVSSTFDLNRDGRSELVSGAPFDGPAGAVWLFSLRGSPSGIPAPSGALPTR